MDFLKSFISHLKNNKSLLKPEVKSNDKKNHSAAEVSVKKSIDITNNILQSNVDVEVSVTQYSNTCSGVKIVKKLSKDSLTKTDNKSSKKNVNVTSHIVPKNENSIKNAMDLRSLESCLNKAGVSITKVRDNVRLAETEKRNNNQQINNKHIHNDNNINTMSKGLDTVPTSGQNIALMNIVDKSTIASKDLNNNPKSHNINDQTKLCLKEFDDILAKVQRKDSFKNADAESPTLEDIEDILEKELENIDSTYNFQEIKHIDFNNENKTRNILEEPIFDTVITRIHNDASEQKKFNDNIDVISLSSDKTPITSVEISSYFETVPKEAIGNDIKEKIILDVITDVTSSLNTDVEMEIISNCKASQDDCVKDGVKKSDQTNISKIMHAIFNEKIELHNTDVTSLSSDNTPRINTAVENENVANFKDVQDESIKNDVKEANQTNISKIMHDLVKEIQLDNTDVISLSSDDTPILDTCVEFETIANTNIKAPQDERSKNDLNDMTHDTDNNDKNNKQSHYSEEGDNVEVISINSDTDDDCGYHSSDFEFISEEEAKLDGFIINFDLKTHNIESKIKGQNSDTKKAFSRKDLYASGPSSRNARRTGKYKSRKEFVLDKSYIENYTLPEENEYLNMFHEIIPGMPPSEIHFLENKSVRVRAPMLVQYEGIGFDMNLAIQRADSSDEEYWDEAKESQKKILEMYPYENMQRKRRRRF